MFQSYSELGCHGPSVGTLVPPDSEIHAVALQNLIKLIIFSHSDVKYWTHRPIPNNDEHKLAVLSLSHLMRVFNNRILHPLT